jgi:LTXXQ motif family protein
MRALTVLPILAVLSFATAALADPPANTIMKVNPPDENKPPVSPQTICLQKYKLELAGLGQLGARLNLAAAQKPKFDAWKKAMLDMQKGVPCPPLPMGLNAPAPKRVENEITMLSATLDGLRKEVVALRALYAALTPDQRAVLDGPMRMSAPPPAASPAPPPAPPAPSH